MKSKVILISGLLMLAGFVSAADNQNRLTDKEKAEGWKLLFNGTSFEGWRGYKMPAMPESGWEIKDGTIRAQPKAKTRDIITTGKFNNFDFRWEWRISPAGNNGIKYFVTEERSGAPGHEYQMIDDKDNAERANGPTHATAAFYDVLPAPDDKPLKPAGEWNESRVRVQGNKVEHWLNGKLVLEYELGTERVKTGLAKSKFAKFPDFGTKIQGHIMLTYHGDECWFRNLKIRELP